MFVHALVRSALFSCVWVCVGGRETLYIARHYCTSLVRNNSEANMCARAHTRAKRFFYTIYVFTIYTCFVVARSPYNRYYFTYISQKRHNTQLSLVRSIFSVLASIPFVLFSWFSIFLCILARSFVLLLFSCCVDGRWLPHTAPAIYILHEHIEYISHSQDKSMRFDSVLILLFDSSTDDGWHT